MDQSFFGERVMWTQCNSLCMFILWYLRELQGHGITYVSMSELLHRKKRQKRVMRVTYMEALAQEILTVSVTESSTFLL